MTLRLQPYPAYKHSGAEWLGQIPAHWAKFPLRAFTTPQSNRGRADLPLLSVYREYGVILKASREDNHNPDGSDLSNYKVVQPGNLVLNKMKTWQGSLGISQHYGIVSPAYIVCKVTGPIIPAYLHRLLRARPYINRYNELSFGVRIGQWDMRYEDFKQIPIYVPPIDEQDAIARFLEHTDRRTNRLIKAKRRLIELLHEQKQTVIHRAVTIGLDPDAPRKPSGMDWLGDIPAHWHVQKLGRHIHLTTGFPFSSEGFSQDEIDIRLLRGVNIMPQAIRWSDVVRWPVADTSRLSDFMLNVDDIVFGMDRPIISTGIRVAKIQADDIPSLLLQRVARVRMLDSLNSDYAYLLLNSKHFIEYLAPIFTGISVPHVSPEQIKNFKFALPPVDEQTTIISHTKRENAQFDIAINLAKREIELIREYRTRLIADVVTGKIDVRNVDFPVSEISAEWESMEPDENGADLNVLDEEAIEEFAELSANKEGTA